MFTEKNSNYFINLCRQYSDATLIPTTLRDNSVVLFSYQGEQMGLPHSQEPDAYIYNPYPNGPEFCGERHNLQNISWSGISPRSNGRDAPQPYA